MVASGDFGRVFAVFDKDGDGKISAAELRLCMAAMLGEDMSVKEAEAIVASVDADGDGLLSEDEFVKFIQTEEEEGRELREAFGMYEMEGQGCITPLSLKQMLSRLGTHPDIEECRAMILRFDLNGDGVLSFDEFKIMMMH